ncbi:MAG: STAS domain-containing protein [Candidatus Thiodiazotropha sp.]
MTPDSASEAQIVRQGAFHYQVQGAMTFATARGLLQQSRSLFGQQAEMDIDLSGVKRADSAGLALLLEWKAEALQRNASLRLRGMPESLLSVAKLCQIESLLREENPPADDA